MNTSHYPSLELCKKLTEIGFTTANDSDISFPITEMSYHNGRIIKNEYTEFWAIKNWFSCPSVMEMLDVMPLGAFKITYALNWTIRHDSDFVTVWELPNALAEMILWLHENNYISFSK